MNKANIVGHCNGFANGKTFFCKMKNLCLQPPCFLHLKLQKATNSVGKQALAIKLLFLLNYLARNFVFPGVLGIFGSSGNQPRGTALYSEVFQILFLSFSFTFWLRELQEIFHNNQWLHLHK